jgi:hypothetical protein
MVIIMFEKYFDLLDELKQKKFSDSIHKIRINIIDALVSDKFSPHLHPFLMHLRRDATRLRPFTNFSDDPKQVIQIKEMMNALYHAELALRDAEEINLRGSNILKVKDKISGLTTLYSKTLEHIYQAGHLFTHLDYDFWGIFGEELKLLIPILSELKHYVGNYEEDTQRIAAQINLGELPRNMGLFSGIAVYQMNPKGGEPDYEFITQFSAVLPIYLEKITKYIEQFSSTVTENVPGIKGPDLDKLQDHALQILTALEHTRGNNLFLPLKTLHYIHLIRHTITLSMSIFDQIGLLNQSTQETIRKTLKELKFNALPALFGFADKMEEQTLLAPGTLTNPLMKQITRLYQMLIGHTKKFVDFSEQGQELLTLPDHQFTAERLSHTYLRMAKVKTSLLMINQAKKATEGFFEILQAHQDENPYIVDLPNETKERLRNHYKLMQPFIIKFDITFDDEFINSLTKPRAELKAGLWSAPGKLVQDVFAQKEQLESQFANAITSQTFHFKLNNDLISSCTENATDLNLSPHNSNTNVFEINEARLLDEENPHLEFEKVHGNNQLANPKQLTKNQAIKLYQCYETNLLKLSKAEEAYVLFIFQLSNISNAPNYASSIIHLRNLYRIFQPYLASSLSLNRDDIDNDFATLNRDELINRDKACITVFATNTMSFGQELRIDYSLIPLFNIRGREEARFASAKRQLLQRRDVFIEQIKACLEQELADKPLTTEFNASRAHHVIKHTEYSSAIADIRKSMEQLKTFFNKSIKKQLQQNVGLPFPEISDTHQALAQSSQALGMKRFFNALYYIEQFIVSLESLHDQSNKKTFAYNIIQAAGHAANAYLLIDSLLQMPYFYKIAGELKNQLQGSHLLLLELQHHYSPEITSDDDLEVKPQGPIFYGLNAMAILPEHIRALRTNESLTKKTTDILHQFCEKSAEDIERILKNSNSYFKLFLETPTMYRLFRELKIKLTELTQTAHTAAVENIDSINDELFTGMLLEGDQFEDSLGLIPGVITNPMKEIFDAFYQGFLEPLALSSEKNIALATSNHPTKRRQRATLERKEQTARDQNILIEKQTIIKGFSDALGLYKKTKSNALSREKLATLRSHVITYFKRALPILLEESTQFKSDIPPANERQQQLDTWLNASILPVSRVFNVEELIKACLSYFAGINASHQLILDTAEEKLSYLDNLLSKHPDMQARYLDKYTEACFKKKKSTLISSIQIGAIDNCSKLPSPPTFRGLSAKSMDPEDLPRGVGYGVNCQQPLDFKELREEYIKELNLYLEGSKDLILLAAKNSAGTGVDEKIARLLHSKENQFKEDNYRNYYQLNRIKNAISQLRSYLNNPNLLFENELTLQEKDSQLTALETLIEPTNTKTKQPIPVTQRLNDIKKYLHDNRLLFQDTMCDYALHDSFTLNWLKQRVLWLLELLYLYTPEQKACYNNIIQSIKPLPDDLNPATRFGFFGASNSRSFDLPTTDRIREQSTIEQATLA